MLDLRWDIAEDNNRRGLNGGGRTQQSLKCLLEWPGNHEEFESVESGYTTNLSQRLEGLVGGTLGLKGLLQLPGGGIVEEAEAHRPLPA